MNRAAVFIGSVLALVTSATAEAQQVVTLTLEEAVRRGLAESHRLAELEARGAGARAAVDGRRAAQRPQLSLLGGYMRTNHVDEFGVPTPGGQFRVIYPDVPDNYRARLDLEWPIFTAGRADALVRAAAAEARAAGDELDAARADLRFEITRAFWALVTAGRSVGVIEAAVERMDAHLGAVRARLDAGLIPPSDVLAVEAQRSRQQVLLIEARNARDVAAADVRRLTGLPADAIVAVDAPLEPPPPAPGDLASLVAQSRDARPERRALTDRVAAAEARVEAVAAERRPAIGVTGGVDYARPNPRIFPRAAEWRESWDVSVNVRWPLWDGGRVRAAMAESAAAAQAAEHRVAEFDRLVELEVRQRALDLASARAAIQAAEDGVRSAAEARRVSGERFSAGVATSTDLLDAQVALLEADLDRTRALASARLAEARLTRALGR